MAKRKRPPDKNPSLLRRGEKTFQEISDYALTLGEQAAEMKALADAMTKAGLETVPMDGVTKMDRALELAHDFLGNFETALVESRRQKKKAQLESRRAQATAGVRARRCGSRSSLAIAASRQRPGEVATQR